MSPMAQPKPLLKLMTSALCRIISFFYFKKGGFVFYGIDDIMGIVYSSLCGDDNSLMGY